MIDPGLYFDGVLNAHKHEPIENDPRIINQINLNVLKVYFTEREPETTWGYPTQMDDWYIDAIKPMNYENRNETATHLYVTISNPSTYYYQM